MYRPWVTPERLAFLARVKRLLRQAGLPVPETFAITSGTELGLNHHRPIEVEEFVAHDGYATTWEQYRIAFGMLGRLHSVLAAAQPADSYVPPQVENYGLPETQLVWLDNTHQVIASLTASPQRDQALYSIDETRQLLEILVRWWHADGGGLPQQPVHGDYGGENILFRRQEIMALLDFDLLAIHERAYELAYTLYWMFERLAQHQHVTRWEWQRVRPLLAAYQANRIDPLQTVEMQAIPYEMVRVPLYWIAEAGWTDNPLQAVLRYRAHITNARWILDHVTELVESCTLR